MNPLLRLFGKKPDPDDAMVTALSKAFDAGKNAGYIEGVKFAMESQADAFDTALASTDFPAIVGGEDVRSLVQGFSRSCKQCAAEVEEVTS